MLFHTSTSCMNNPLHRFSLIIMLVFLGALRLQAQGIQITHCSADTLVFADTTQNEPALYQDLLVVNTVNQGTDQPEGEAELWIEALGACVGTNISVDYTLYLDLNADGSQETVISSTATPTFGVLQYANSGGPGITVAFDQDYDGDGQAVAFGLKTSIVNGKKRAQLVFKTALNYQDAAAGVLPQLPYGLHRIVWEVRDTACQEVRTCTQVFRIRDVQAPVLECKPIYTVVLLPTPMTDVYSTEVMTTLSDNSASPIDVLMCFDCLSYPNKTKPLINGQPMAPELDYLRLSCCNIGVVPFTVWAKDESGNISSCKTTVLVQDNSQCGYIRLEGKIFASGANGFCGLENLDFQIPLQNNAAPLWQPLDTALQLTSMQTGYYGFLPLQNCFLPTDFTPTKTDDWYNGVNMLDVLKIQRHILGLEPITDPFRQLAADVNNSNSITSADVTALRMIILGGPSANPPKPSYVFYPKEIVFNDPSNPFAGYTIPAPAQPRKRDFVVVKTGNVSGGSGCSATAGE